MNKNLQKTLAASSTTLEEFSQDFTPEQHKIVEEEILYYDVLSNLKLTRKLGITQDQLALKAKLPRTTISKVESGKYNPTLSTLVSMATAMDKTLQIKVV